MVKLNCNVQSCIHNAENCCCKGSILVEGHDAKKSENTYCASYYEKSGDSFRNKFETPDTAAIVDCDASNCKYNENHMCCAEQIRITGSHAKNSGETECSAFVKR